MIGKFVFYFLAAACSLVGLCICAIATTKNVDIIVTHNSSVLSTYTI